MEHRNAGEAIARAARVLSRLGYMDPTGSISVRAADDLIAITPLSSHAPPFARMAAKDVVYVNTRRQIVEGKHPPSDSLPQHLSIYGGRDDAGAIMFVSPPTSMAFAVASVPLRPVTHAEAWIVERAIPILDPGAFYEAQESASSFAAEIGEAQIAHIRGLYALFIGKTIDKTLAASYSYEYLARVNLMIRELPHRDLRDVSDEEIASIQKERGLPETRATVDPARFFDAFDSTVSDGESDTLRLDTGTFTSRSIASVKGKVALSCRILASRKTLVGFYEHVSHRLDGGSKFVMSPAKDFGSMQPDDMAIIAQDADATWLEGPYPPAPYRQLHRDIFSQRPDVNAIVHTHEMFGRAFTTTSTALEPVTRFGTGFDEFPPTLDRACMAFNPSDRSDLIRELGDGDLVHTIAHGTDYVAESIGMATVAAVHREAAYADYHLASRIGHPKALPASLISDVAASMPDVRTWWNHYAALLPET